jgi:hypothetical protein
MAIRKTWEAFEPPKYIASLIAAINDGAKSAQLGALAFTAIGLFLLATAISAPDEDLLLNRVLTVSQLSGAAVPLVFANFLAPAIFVGAHLYILIRYDMLAGNLRRFRKDLAAMVAPGAGRDRCRQLLTNIEFVNVLVMPKGSRVSSRVFSCALYALLAVFPVVVLLIMQLQSLRLQSRQIVWTNHFFIAADLALLVWFFGRLLGLWRRGRGRGPWWRHFWRRQRQFGRACAPLLSAAAVVIIAVIGGDLLWLQRPCPTSETVGETLESYRSRYNASAPLMQKVEWLVAFQPVDLLLCRPGVRFCRFLSVQNRVAVDKVWDGGTFVKLRASTDVGSEQLASVDGASLRQHKLRFANLTDSYLFRAELDGADLRGAILIGTRLQGANLTGALLQGANLTDADLTSAQNLTQAQLDGACGKPKALPEGLKLDKPCPKAPVASPVDKKATP